MSENNPPSDGIGNHPSEGRLWRRSSHQRQPVPLYALEQAEDDVLTNIQDAFSSQVRRRSHQPLPVDLEHGEHDALTELQNIPVDRARRFSQQQSPVDLEHTEDDKLADIHDASGHSQFPDTVISAVRRRSSHKMIDIELDDSLGRLPSMEDDDGVSPGMSPSTRTNGRKGSFFRKPYEPLRSDSESSTISEKDEEEHNDKTAVDQEQENGHGRIKFRDYLDVLVRYPGYKYYLCSHLCQHIGDWFVRIASLLMVEELAPDSGSSLANLALSVLLPQAIFSQVGGVLADHYDRRKLMIVGDAVAGVSVLGYLFAIHYKSVTILYAVSTLRSAIGSTYYPITTGIVPLLVPNVRDLQLAVTMNSWAWCTMAMVGGIVAGTATAYIGLQACYIIDCVTYFVSVLVVYFGISGNFNVSTLDKQEANDTAPTTRMPLNPKVLMSILGHEVQQLIQYLGGCNFGMLVFMKGSAALVWGPEDVIGVLYATVEGDEKASSVRMGMLFSVVGTGCLLGPMVVNCATGAASPLTIQRSCWIGLLLLAVGWLCISTTATFPAFLMGTLVRTLGSGIAWPYSTLLLQTLVEPQILGRVVAVEFTLMTLLQVISVTATGNLSDRGVSKQGLARFGAFLGFATVIFWGIYHFILRKGAAQPVFNGPNYQSPTERRASCGGLQLKVVRHRDMQLEEEDTGTDASIN